MQKLRCENNALALIYDLQDIIEHIINKNKAKGDQDLEGIPIAWAIKNYIDFYLNMYYKPTSDRK